MKIKTALAHDHAKTAFIGAELLLLIRSSLLFFFLTP